MPKRPIREKLLAERRHCSAETCLQRSLQIQARFLAGDAYRQARCLGLYSPFQNEVQTEAVARQCIADGKLLAYASDQSGRSEVYVRSLGGESGTDAEPHAYPGSYVEYVARTLLARFGLDWLGAWQRAGAIP